MLTQVAMTGLDRMLLNSFVMLTGSTVVTCWRRERGEGGRDMTEGLC